MTSGSRTSKLFQVRTPAAGCKPCLISLGAKPDVAFQLRMHSGDNTPHVFDWLTVPALGLIEMLRRDFDVFAPEHLQVIERPGGSLVTDRVTGVHIRYGFERPSDYLGDYTAFMARFRRLAARFRDSVSDGPVLLVRRDISQAQANELEAVFFARFPDAEARFLYLNDASDAFATAHGYTRPVSVDSLVGDCEAWADLLSAEGLIDTPYRLSPMDILDADPEGPRLRRQVRMPLAHLEDAVAANPDNAGFACELSRLHRSKGRIPEAEAAIARAIAQAPDHPAVRLEDMNVRKAAGYMSDAVYAQGLLAMADRDHPTDAVRMAAEALSEARDFEGALGAYTLYLSAYPRDAEAYLGKAACLRRLKRFAEADMAVTRSLELAPDIARAHVLRSQILLALRRGSESVAAAMAACEGSAAPRQLYNLASVYESVSETDKAIEVYDRIRALGHDVNGKALERLKALRGDDTVLTLQTRSQEPVKPAWPRLFGSRG